MALFCKACCDYFSVHVLARTVVQLSPVIALMWSGCRTQTSRRCGELHIFAQQVVQAVQLASQLLVLYQTCAQHCHNSS